MKDIDDENLKNLEKALKAGIDPNKILCHYPQSNDHTTMLLQAVGIWRNFPAVKLLVQYNAKLDMEVLDHALYSTGLYTDDDSTEIAEFVLKQPYYNAKILNQPVDGKNILCSALSSRKDDISAKLVTLLIQKGADPKKYNCRTEINEPIGLLDLAKENNLHKTVSILSK